jgi:Xaa-Pro aminopeptidase
MTEKTIGSGLTTNERDRRWTLLRKRLREAGLSALIVYGFSQLGVPVHYLTRMWGNKMNLVIFPVDGDPVFLVPSNSGLTPESLTEQGCWIKTENIHLSSNLARDTAEYIKNLHIQKGTVGVDSFQWWPVNDYHIFQELNPNIRLVDAHRLFGEIRGPKSDEELALMKNAIKISDMAHYAFLINLKSGMTEAEAAAPAIEVLDSHGVGDRIILIHSRPEATFPNRPGPVIIEKPNPVTFSPEFTLNAGYGAQMIRAYWWEKPKGIYKTMFELWADMRQMVIEELRPGIEITRFGQLLEELIDRYGFECDKLGHGVGLSYGDAPYITAGPHQKESMEWTVQAREVYAVHPMARCPGYVAPWSMIGDMFFVGENGTQWMTQALPDLPEMIP